jgi:putative endonuclease
MSYFVYILYSEKIDKYYVGKTENPKVRLEFHNSDHNRIWTKRGQPWKIVKLIEFENSTLSSKSERFIKKQKSRKFI